MIGDRYIEEAIRIAGKIEPIVALRPAGRVFVVDKKPRRRRPAKKQRMGSTPESKLHKMADFYRPKGIE